MSWMWSISMTSREGFILSILNLPKIKLMADYALFLPNDHPIPELLGGLTRGSLYSDFGLYVLPFRLLDPIHAYIFNEVVYRSVAFAGMVLLLSPDTMVGPMSQVVHSSASHLKTIPTVVDSWGKRLY